MLVSRQWSRETLFLLQYQSAKDRIAFTLRADVLDSLVSRLQM
jgi:hypothetical protein